MTSSYAAVLSAAIETGRVILKTPVTSYSPKLRFVTTEAHKLLLAYPTFASIPRGSEIVFDIFDLLKESWPKISRGETSFDQLIGQTPGLWEKFMTDFPLGQYAEVAAKVLIREKLLHGKILELGAGVGNTSRLVVGQVNPDQYTRSDLNIKLLKEIPFPSRIAQYDFNRPGRWENLDTIFATNALHCAQDKILTLKHLHSMLRPGGTLLLSEGTPRPQQDSPWALTYLCGFFDGWWDQGGFLSQEDWKDLMTQAGFHDLKTEVIQEGPYQLGGVVWGHKL